MESLHWTKVVLTEFSPLLLVLWRAQHPEGHEQKYIAFNVRKPKAQSMPLMSATLKNMATWTGRVGAGLRSFVDESGTFWLEQNSAKTSKWAKLARKGHDVAWEFAGRGGEYTGRMLVDGELYTPSEAIKKFLKKEK